MLRNVTLPKHEFSEMFFFSDVKIFFGYSNFIQVSPKRYTIVLLVLIKALVNTSKKL